MDNPQVEKGPYVREAYTTELGTIAHVLSLAFADNPIIHWLGGSQEGIDLK